MGIVRNITVDDLRNYINQNSSFLSDREGLYDRYTGDVDILDRAYFTGAKAENRIAHDFRGNITDIHTGYCFGKPIDYSISDVEFKNNKRGYQRLSSFLQGFKEKNSLDKLDYDSGKWASVCGYACRLIYIDTAGNERVAVIPPYQCIFHEDLYNKVDFAIRIYEVTENNKTVRYLELYDEIEVAFYRAESGNGFSVVEIKPHLFEGIPLIRFKNNNEMIGDFEKVESIIDTYDRVISDAANELEETRIGLLILSGIGLHPDSVETITDEIAKAKTDTQGSLLLPEGGSANYLMKDLPTAFLKEWLDRAEVNIFRFSAAVDMSEEKFSSGGAMSGESRKWRLLAMEQKSAEKERLFTLGLKEQFKLLCSSWQRKGIIIDPDSIKFTFTRNIPMDILYNAEAFGMLYGKIPNKESFKLIPTCDDPDRWVSDMRIQKAEELEQIQTSERLSDIENVFNESEGNK